MRQSAFQNHLDHFMELYVLLACIIGFFFCLALVGIAIQYTDASSLRQLGYEAKVINLQCYAKTKTGQRWLTCGALTKNQLEVTHEEQ